MKKFTVSVVGLMMTAASPMITKADDNSGSAGEKNPIKMHKNLVIEDLGPTNSLVRVYGDGRYLMLPVEEAQPDASVNVIINGNQQETIFVRMAKDSVDYFVPFDLEPFKGKYIVFNIVTQGDTKDGRGRDSGRREIYRERMFLTDTLVNKNVEKFRPLYHHTPEYGWMNDPNGMFYKDGVWHLYFQWNPYGSKWQNMTWGHSTSKDLIHWTYNPTAIQPDGNGSIFSGSCAIDVDGSAGFGKDAVVAMFTSARESQMQSLAYSADNGLTFHKFYGNPVLTLPTEARDPNMFWNPETKLWTLVLAHSLEKDILVFTSPDMKRWTLVDEFGKGEGAQGGVWECPDLFKLKVDGSDKDVKNSGKEKWVMLVNINPGGPFGGSGTQYFIGDFDGKTFTADTDSEGKIPTKWMDFGKDNYASVSWSDAPDHRRVIIGWMSNWQYADKVPTMQYRSANTLPRDVSLFAASDSQIYMASNPSPELLGLRGKIVASAKSVDASKRGVSFILPNSNDGVCEILLDLLPHNAKKEAADYKDITLTLSNQKGEKVIMTYNPREHTFCFDRDHSGITNFDRHFDDKTTAPTFCNGKELSLRIFVDRSSIEVFGNDGKFVLTNLVFPNKPYTTLTVTSADGKGKVKNLKIYELNLKGAE